MDFLALIIAAAALVWTVWFVLRGSLICGCLAAILAASCFGYPFWHLEGAPIPLTSDRALIALLALTYVVHRRWGMADPKALGAAEWVLIALLGVLALATFSHDWRDHNNQPVARLLFYWILPAVVYWIARQSPLDERGVRWILATLAFFGVYLALTAMAEWSRQWWAVFPPYIASPTTEYYGRARGPFLHPAEMGIYLTLCLAAALTFWQRSGRVTRLLLLALAALSIAGIYATLTRCAWMGGGLGLTIFIGFSVPRQWRTLLLGCGGAAAVVMLAVSWDSIWNLKRDVKLDASASADSAELRPILAKIAWDMFRDRPLLGCGLAQYDHEKLPYLADRSSELPLEKGLPYVQHNAFFALMVETGILGMGLFALLMVLWVRNGWRLWTATEAPPVVRQAGLLLLTLIGAYLPNAMFQDTNIIDGVNLLLFFFAGSISGLAANLNCSQQTASAFTGVAQRPRVETLQHAAV